MLLLPGVGAKVLEPTTCLRIVLEEKKTSEPPYSSNSVGRRGFKRYLLLSHERCDVFHRFMFCCFHIEGGVTWVVVK
jgi:hypothetical protein